MAARGVATLIGLVGLFTLPFGVVLIALAIFIHVALES